MVFSFSTLELCKEYQEEAYTVSLHPTGLFCLVGFSDKLRFISLLYEDMRIFKEFAVKKCREVRNGAKMKLGSYGEQNGEEHDRNFSNISS